MIGNYVILEKGQLNEYDQEQIASYLKLKMNSDYLEGDIVQIRMNFNQGNGSGTSWGCDLSKKYVEINSEYTT